jgi:hypothetical protein
MINLDENEIEMPKYYIVLCYVDFYDRKNHPDYLIFCKFQYHSNINRLFKEINYFSIFLKYHVNRQLGQFDNIYIRNLKKILQSDSCMQPEIALCYQKPCGKNVCILKTFWIRIIQRKWKSYYLKKKQFLLHPKNIYLKQINGRIKHTY